MRGKPSILVLVVTILVVLTVSSLMNFTYVSDLNIYAPESKEPTTTTRDVDLNTNKISDIFEEFLDYYRRNKVAEYPYNVVLPDAQGRVEVIISSNTNNFDADIVNFESLGGMVTHIWNSPKDVFTGFAGKIPIDNIENFVQKSSENIELIEQNFNNNKLSNTANKLTRLNPYVWNDLGFKGDANMSIAVMDSGIDDSHSAFSPGYGDLDWSKKIIGWYDATSDGSLTPEDFDGHGSHVAGILASNPYNSSTSDGRLKTTFSFTYTDSGVSGYLSNYIFVNKTGTIDVNYLWQQIAGSGSAVGTELILADPDNFIATQDTSGSSNMSVSHDVASVSDFGMWTIYYGVDYETGGDKTISISSYAIYPFEDQSLGEARFSGVAPDTKLVGVKIFDNSGGGTSTDAVDGFNWIANNKETYHITIVSGSFGFDQTISSVDTAAANLVDQGVAVVIAAGNSGQPGTNQIYSPGHVDEVITVAASDDFNMVTDYSSEGPGDSSTTIKPDITAPGGNFTQGAILQVDSNDNDGTFADQLADDFTNLQGTSMSTPFVAGVLALMIEAMGGYDNWQYGTNTNPLFLKQHLLATASEIYQNQRTTKDDIEGAGLINPDAAIEAIINQYQLTAIISEDLDHSGAARKVWASKVELNSSSDNVFDLDVPSTGDFDMFLYDINPNQYGEPVLAKSSTNTVGLDEQIIVNTTLAASYILVVKTANDADSYGEFILTSTSTAVPDESPPDITSPEDITYKEGSLGNVISWEAIDASPSEYEIKENNVTIVGPTSWDNGVPIEINVDGRAVGSYEFELIIWDIEGNQNNDSVIVTVIEIDKIAPNISSPSDIELVEGTSGNLIVWAVGDVNPGTYTLIRDGVTLEDNVNWVNGTVEVSLDTLSEGIYEFTLIVYDLEGNTSSDSVVVTVIADTNTIEDSKDEPQDDEDDAPSLDLLSYPYHMLGVLLVFVILRSVRRRSMERK